MTNDNVYIDGKFVGYEKEADKMGSMLVVGKGHILNELSKLEYIAPQEYFENGGK